VGHRAHLLSRFVKGMTVRQNLSELGCGAPQAGSSLSRAVAGRVPWRSRGAVRRFTLLDFMDSSGLRALLDAKAVLERAGHSLVVVSPSDPVTTVLEMTGLHKALSEDPR
jgi:hypothetical protein